MAPGWSRWRFVICAVPRWRPHAGRRSRATDQSAQSERGERRSDGATEDSHVGARSSAQRATTASICVASGSRHVPLARSGGHQTARFAASVRSRWRREFRRYHAHVTAAATTTRARSPIRRRARQRGISPALSRALLEAWAASATKVAAGLHVLLRCQMGTERLRPERGEHAPADTRSDSYVCIDVGPWRSQWPLRGPARGRRGGPGR